MTSMHKVCKNMKISPFEGFVTDALVGTEQCIQNTNFKVEELEI